MVLLKPCFYFCATKAAMKGLTMDQMRQAGTQVILSIPIIYHLQPGAKRVEKMGGFNTLPDGVAPC